MEGYTNGEQIFFNQSDFESPNMWKPDSPDEINNRKKTFDSYYFDSCSNPDDLFETFTNYSSSLEDSMPTVKSQSNFTSSERPTIEGNCVNFSDFGYDILSTNSNSTITSSNYTTESFFSQIKSNVSLETFQNIERHVSQDLTSASDLLSSMPCSFNTSSMTFTNNSVYDMDPINDIPASNYLYANINLQPPMTKPTAEADVANEIIFRKGKVKKNQLAKIQQLNETHSNYVQKTIKKQLSKICRPKKTYKYSHKTNKEKQSDLDLKEQFLEQENFKLKVKIKSLENEIQKCRKLFDFLSQRFIRKENRCNKCAN